MPENEADTVMSLEEDDTAEAGPGILNVPFVFGTSVAS